MYINPQWRILTIGDGDLSFSASLLKHHQPKQLTATIFDDKACLVEKYGDSYYQQLQQKNCQVLTGFDVTNEQTWGRLEKHSFDVVIFQFPLLPAFSSKQDFQARCKTASLNTLHRALLRNYLLSCFKYFLDSQGARLAFITSKDVKPYHQWNIEESIIRETDINYIGRMNFDITKFPDYKVRNVDRDKHVKTTKGITYIYSDESFTKSRLALEADCEEYIVYDTSQVKRKGERCIICQTGRFGNEEDKNLHLLTAKHQQMAVFEQQWINYLEHQTKR